MDLKVNIDFFPAQNGLVFKTEKKCVQNGYEFNLEK